MMILKKLMGRKVPATEPRHATIDSQRAREAARQRALRLLDQTQRAAKTKGDWQVTDWAAI